MYCRTIPPPSEWPISVSGLLPKRIDELREVDHVVNHRVGAADRVSGIAMAAQIGRDHVIMLRRSSAVQSQLRQWSRPPCTRIISGAAGLPQST